MKVSSSARGWWATPVARHLFVCALLLACFSAFVLAQTPKQRPAAQGPKGKRTAKKALAIAPDVRAALDRISADSLRGHLSFLASDALEGRGTPSRGLAVAAEYLAAQFRRAGLEPGGDPLPATQSGQASERSFFQTAVWEVSARTERGVRLTTSDGRQRMFVRENVLTALGVNTGPPPPARPPAVEGGVPVPVGEETIAPPTGDRSVKLRNVIGLLRGSDPVLKETYVIVSAHYDHLGTQDNAPDATADRIFNGANDDGSGTVSVVEIASALARLKVRPKRSILFIAWFGEEPGLLGSRYYGNHPVFPLAQTVAMLNLEQVGRTDDSEGPQVNSASLTGFDFSEVGALLQAAGERTGIKVYKHPQNSDAFFGRSDNQALADAGIPAHTLCVAFNFPDYHGLGDHWEKIDYENMAKVDRAVALALVTLANQATAPKWNEANPKTAQYVQAWKKLHGK